MTSASLRSSEWLTAVTIAFVTACTSAPSGEEILISQAASRPAPTEAPPIPSRSLQRDAQGFYYQPPALADDYPEETTTREKIITDLETVREVGSRYLRFGIGWDGIEERPGEYHWRFWDQLVELAPRYGVTLLPYVCYTPEWASGDKKDFWRKPPKDLNRFARFMRAIATRYRGKIRSWELWNEPDNKDYWLGTPEQFAEMARLGAQAVREADPEAWLVIGGMANARGSFIDAQLKTEGLGRFFDVLNIHSYVETWSQDSSESLPRRIFAFSGLIRETAPKLDLWMAEFGYSNFRMTDRKVSEWSNAVFDYEHTPGYQAVILWKHHVLALSTEEVSLTTWYRIHDLPQAEAVIGDNNNKRFGILDAKNRPKPAYYAMKLYNRIFDQPVRDADRWVSISRPESSQSVVRVFEKKDGSFVVTAWLRSVDPSEISDTSGKAKDPRRETLSIRLPIASVSEWKSWEATGREAPPGPTFHQGVLQNVNLQGGSIFIAELKPQRP